MLDTSMGARAEPLFLTISTQNNDSDHTLSKPIDAGLDRDDPETVCHLYAAPDYLDIDDPKAHKAANPALGDFRDRDDLLNLMRQAQKLSSREPAFRNLYLNQRVNPLSPLIPAKLWAALPSGTIETGERIYLALDLGFSSDFCALAAIGVALIVAAGQLDLSLGRGVVGSAQGLEFAEPEEVVVATMRDDVVGHGRGCDDAALTTEPAEGFAPKLLSPAPVLSTPACEVIPTVNAGGGVRVE